MLDYEIRVAGPIGRVVASCLPGFSLTALPPGTVLRGTIANPDELRRVLDILHAHGLPHIDLAITAEAIARPPNLRGRPGSSRHFVQDG